MKRRAASPTVTLVIAFLATGGQCLVAQGSRSPSKQSRPPAITTKPADSVWADFVNLRVAELVSRLQRADAAWLDAELGGASLDSTDQIPRSSPKCASVGTAAARLAGDGGVIAPNGPALALHQISYRVSHRHDSTEAHLRLTHLSGGRQRTFDVRLTFRRGDQRVIVVSGLIGGLCGGQGQLP